MQSFGLQYNRALFSIQYGKVLYSTALYCTLFYCTVLYTKTSWNNLCFHTIQYSIVQYCDWTNQLGLAIIRHMINKWMSTLYNRVFQILDCLRHSPNVLSFAQLFKWIMTVCSVFCILSKPFAHCFFDGECFTQMNIVHNATWSLSKLLKIVWVLQIVSFIQSNVSSDLRSV